MVEQVNSGSVASDRRMHRDWASVGSVSVRVTPDPTGGVPACLLRHRCQSSSSSSSSSGSIVVVTAAAISSIHSVSNQSFTDGQRTFTGT